MHFNSVYHPDGMTTDTLRRLEAARRELAEATQALSLKHSDGEWERWRAAYQNCLTLERDLARSLDEECAVEIGWPAPWDTGAPLPHVLSSGRRTFIVYNQSERDPHWDGSYAQVVDPRTPEMRLIATVEFEHCLVHKFGSPNDEVLEGHRLHGKGLSGYRAHVVERSAWLKEIEQINSVHPQYDPASWTGLTHYVLPFHDQTFECIAKGHVLKEWLSTFAEALAACTRLLLG